MCAGRSGAGRKRELRTGVRSPRRDYLNVSVGVYESGGTIVPPMAVPAGWTLSRVTRIKTAVGIPVIGAGRFVDPSVGDRAIAEGRLDIVGMGRALLADPDLPRKVIEGRADEIVHCIGCNHRCVNRLDRQEDVTCLVNPVVGREEELVLRLAPRRRRIAVVGGGPAGMEAARVAAERGHEVTLFERKDRLGGQAAVAGSANGREWWGVLVKDAVARLERHNVRIELAHEATVADLAGSDAVILATGARFLAPAVSGVSPGLLVDPAEVAGADLGDNVVIVKDSDQVALTITALLMARGAMVHLVTREVHLVDPVADPGCFDRLRAAGRLRLYLDCAITRVEGADVVLTKAGAIGELFPERIRAATAIVACDERRARVALGELLREHRRDAAIHEVGDCRRPRTALEAVYEGAVAGRAV